MADTFFLAAMMFTENLLKDKEAKANETDLFYYYSIIGEGAG